MFSDSDLRFKHDRPSKFCVVTAYQDDLPWRTLGDLTSSTKVAYCKAKGYGFRCYRSGWDVARPMSWSKLHFVLDALRHYEWVFWIDADAIVTNPNVGLSSFITGKEDMVLCRVQHLGEMNRHEQVMNCGVFLLRSGEFAEKLVETLWSKAHCVNHAWWEQKAFIEAYDESEELRSRVRVLPAKAFNSVPLWRDTMSNEAKWSPGDFICHVAAYEVQDRIGIIQRFLAWLREDDPFYENTYSMLGNVIPQLRMRDSGFVVGVKPDIDSFLLSKWTGRAYLADEWRHIPGYRDVSNYTNDEFEARYQWLLAQARQRPGLELVRGNTVETAKGIADECLDWVFLDGPYSFDRVLGNLEAWWSKVRIGGLICGSNYTQNPNHGTACFEVKDAVTRFAASKFVCHRYSENPGIQSWSIRKTGMTVVEPIVMDRDSLFALFEHRRFKRGFSTGDRIGGLRELSLKYPSIEIGWSSGLPFQAREFESQTFDFLHLDSDVEMTREMEEWWDKVRIGGMICGHTPDQESKAKVDEFLAGKGLWPTWTVQAENRAWFLTKTSE